MADRIAKPRKSTIHIDGIRHIRHRSTGDVTSVEHL